MPLYSFNVVISPGQYYYCPPIQATFNLPDWVEPDKIEWARIVIDLDPVRPGLGHGCAVKTEVKLNGRPLTGKGDVCDVFTVDVTPPTTLLKRGNKLVFDINATPECYIGFIMGFWSAYLEGQAYYEGPTPTPTVPPTPTATPPPGEEIECTVFGIPIGKMTREQCGQAQMMLTLMFFGVGAVLLISLLRR